MPELPILKVKKKSLKIKEISFFSFIFALAILKSVCNERK